MFIKNGLILQESNPVLCRQSRIIFRGFRPPPIIFIPIVLQPVVVEIIPADIEADIEGQRFQRRIRVAGVCELTSKKIYQFRVQLQFLTDFIIDFVKMLEVIPIGTFLKPIITV